ncbi:hypothetical protein [Enterobacter roggenkampii]|uniref:hypothetical protein n=1 Tax=Enterobacter roggenkampii TaxID=1812935 RepID=UPI00107EE72B|nr:hypothetical protein [Enterobacter roggenkampii]QBX83405.1 hypothetical protein E4005_00460 [Enterobacter roggenkampii]
MPYHIARLSRAFISAADNQFQMPAAIVYDGLSLTTTQHPKPEVECNGEPNKWTIRVKIGGQRPWVFSLAFSLLGYVFIIGAISAFFTIKPITQNVKKSDEKTYPLLKTTRREQKNHSDRPAAAEGYGEQCGEFPGLD